MQAAEQTRAVPRGEISPAVKPDGKPDTISEQARMALARAKGDVNKAARLLEAAVRKSPSLWQALLEPLVTYACHNAVAKQHRENRDRVWSSPNIDRSGITDQQRVQILAASNLLMFPLPGGKKLAEANRSEIEEASEIYQKQSTDMAHKARWLQLISQSVPSGKRVADVLTNERLRELQEEAANV